MKVLYGGGGRRDSVPEEQAAFDKVMWAMDGCVPAWNQTEVTGMV